MKVRAYRDSDWPEWLRMSVALFPEYSAESLADGMGTFRHRDDAEVFVVDRGGGALAGFVEVGSRPYADGCDTSPVGYIEAWYTDHDVRRSGYGRALLQAAETWARQQGYAKWRPTRCWTTRLATPPTGAWDTRKSEGWCSFERASARSF